jgi:uncharacterized protein DUF6459
VSALAPAVPAPATAPRLRRRPLPVVEPYPAIRVLDTDRDRPDPPYTQGTLALVMPDRDETAGCRVDGEIDGGVDGGIDGERPAGGVAPAALPDPAAWAAQFVQAAVEVAAGARSAGQLIRWTSLEVQALLARRSALASRIARAGSSRHRAVVRAVLTCRPRDGVCEASAVVIDRGRVRALALRMEGIDGRWRVTALEFG